MDENTLVLLIGAVLIGGIMLPFILRTRRQEQAAVAAEHEAEQLGLGEPATLHPVVDPDRCISTGSCLDVCPEGDVLILRGRQAYP